MVSQAADPSTVAREVLAILDSPRPRAFRAAGRRATLQAFLARHMPRGMVEATMARRFNLRGK